MPDLPPHVPVAIDRAWLAAKALRSGALGAFWNYDWDTTPTEWWHVICDDRDYDVERLEAPKVRWTVRTALARTEVRRVEAAWLLEHGFDLYRRAVARYEGHRARDLEGFRDTIRLARVHPGDPPWEYWGVFGPGDRLLASANVRLQGPCAVLSSATFDPDSKGLYPMNALYYAVCRHYLRDRGSTYVASGSRPVLHGTQIEDFRLKMGWRTCYARLGALVLPPVGWAVAAYRALRGEGREVATGSPGRSPDRLRRCALG